MSEKDAIRTQIVDAAKKRFSHFGYAKTTMAEVAADCSMSPGNLYRFFPGKLDIAEAIATEDYQKHLEHLRKVTSNPKKTARERLHDFFFEELRRTFNKLESDPRAYEMAVVISREKPEFANWMLLQEREILAALLEDGNARGEFASPKPPACAECIQSAMMKFRYPQLWSKLPLPKLEEELEGVMGLVIDGLSPRKHEAAA
ncbi:MAG TPA: TetR/AcrR family transcriptional regulator [Rhizomicrobium sp.]|jgi:AcrR family transcriptional regulator|nr:TetR/AcrR family transcriptional regulator [Rhizomicrobium sp.]